jgi:polysaccharide export outer membrane protein
MCEMTKRTFHLFPTGRRRRWGAAVVAAALLGSGPAAAAQSVLRFVGSEEAPANTADALPEPSIAAAPVAPPSESEFRFLEMREGRVAPLPQLSVSKQDVSTGEQSTLRFSPSISAQVDPTLAGEYAYVDSYELRFKQPEPPLTPTTVAKETRPYEVKSVTQPAPPTVETESPFAQLATELFAHPQQSSQLNPFKPRIVTALEHVPAPAPMHVEAQPVRSAREMSPVYATMPGAELFGRGAPTVETRSPQSWNLPALDYGAALRQVQPVPPPVSSAAQIAPKRVVARQLPADAAGMFALGAPEPLLTQPPAEKRSAPPVVAASPAPSVVYHRPEFQARTDAPAFRPVVQSKPVAPVVAKAPEAAPPASERFVVAKPQLPAAAELDFTSLPAHAEPPRQQFVAVAPRPLNNIVATAKPAVQELERLVPASVADQAPTKPSFAYQPGPLASESHVVEYKPAVVTPPVVSAPERSQVVATVDPQDSNTFSFSYASTNDQAPAMYANGMQPMATEVGPEAVTPSALPAPCACGPGAGGQYGCPYLPGQSGTRALCGVDCGRYGAPCCSTWSDARCIPWALLGPGEYIGPPRPAHVDTYYLRVNDLLTLTFIQSRKKQAEHYRIGVGDELQIEWLQGATANERTLDRNLLVQPDGTVTLPLIGEVTASGKTVNDFRDEVVKLYSKFQRDPQITVTPLTVNVAVQDVLKAVTSKEATSGQTQDLRVTPEGTIQAAGIGSVYVQGLTLDELRSELEARYAEAFGPGLAVSPQLTDRATSYVFMGGEVRTPGRYVLEGPTTVMQAISMAGGWNNGGNVRQVVVFRRDENWCLKATKIDVRAPLYGKDPCPTNDVWLRENDLVIVPKTCILCATDMIELYFTRGIYAVFPITYVYDFSQNSGLVPVP